MKTSTKSILAAASAALFAVLLAFGSPVSSQAADADVIICEGVNEFCAMALVTRNGKTDKKVFHKDANSDTIVVVGKRAE